MKKSRLDSWSDYPFRLTGFKLQYLFIVNTKFFFPKPIFIVSLFLIGSASIISLQFLKVFIPLLAVYWYQKYQVQKSIQGFKFDLETPEKSKENSNENISFKFKNPSNSTLSNFLIFTKNETNFSKKIITNFIESLPPNKKISKIVSQKMNNGMGIKNVGPSVISYTDGIGLNRVLIEDNTAKEIKVYPLVYPTKKPKVFPDLASPEFGLFDTHIKGNNVNFFSTREYREGDSLNRINWKLSLKSDQIIVNEFESNINASVYAVLLDDKRLHYGEGKFSSLEYSKDAILSLFHTLSKGNNDIGFFSSQKFIQSKTGQAHLNALELFLANLDTNTVENSIAYTRKSFSSHEINLLFKKIYFHLPKESNLFFFCGLVPGGVLDYYIKQLCDQRRRGYSIHLVMVYGFKNFMKNTSSEEKIWLSNLEKKLDQEILTIKEICRTNGIKLSFIHMDSRYNYDYVLKESFQIEK